MTRGGSSSDLSVEAEQIAAMKTSAAFLEASAISKRYGATEALREASLRLYPGRVHGLLGENGAGKSTLVKIIVGAVKADSGTIVIAGSPARFKSVADAVSAGIIPIYQHLSLFPHLSILENLSAFAFGRTTRIHARAAMVDRRSASTWLDAVGLQINLDTSVGVLSLGERQLVEIARGIGQRCKVLVLDEPTSALTHDEVGRLFTVVRQLCATGSAVLFISHKFDEIEALADDVTVLRDGRTVIDGAHTARTPRSELVRAMLGDAVDVLERSLPAPQGIMLSARGLRIDRQSMPIDIDIRAGEIVGLAGLVGSGALDIAAALAGARRVAAGTLAVAKQRVPAGSREHAVALGVGYVPNDRYADGLFAVLPAVHNASAATLASFCRAGLLRRQVEAGRLLPWLRRLKLQPWRPNLQAAGFSGGNQQKLVISRSLAMSNLCVLVALEPTRGVDIGARAIIHAAIFEAACRGVAIILASSDLDELMSLSHRILVVRSGQIVQELPHGVDRASLMSMLVGRDAA